MFDSSIWNYAPILNEQPEQKEIFMFDSDEFKEFCLHFRRLMTRPVKSKIIMEDKEKFSRWCACDVYKEAVLLGCVLAPYHPW